MRCVAAFGLSSFLALGAASCGAQGPAGSEPSAKGASAPAVDDPEATELEKQTAELWKLADRPAIDLDKIRLPKPPKGYTRADVQRLAFGVREVIDRSLDPELGAVTPNEAVKSALGGLPPYAARNAKKHAQRVLKNAGGAWQFVYASRLSPAQQEAPTIIDASWTAKVERDDTAEKSRYLVVGLNVIARNQVETDGSVVPVLFRREFFLSAYRPSDYASQPGTNFNISWYGASACRLFNESLLVPTTNADEMEDSVRRLASQLGVKGYPETKKSGPWARGDVKGIATQYCDS